MNSRTIYFHDRIHAGGYHVDIHYKDIRRLILKVNPAGEVRVSAPIGFSREKVTAFVENNTAWIRKRIQTLSQIDLTRNMSEPPSRAEVERFAPVLKEMVRRRSQEMNLYPAKITLRFMTSRWGSCRKDTGSLSFSTMLCREPSECADYVVVHELAHLSHADHSAAFWNLVERHCPGWKELRKRLRE